MNYFFKTIALASLTSLTITSCNNDQNSNDLQQTEQVQLEEANSTILTGIDITELSLEELNNLENELSTDARVLQNDFFQLLEEIDSFTTLRAGRSFIRTQRNLIIVTREFIRRARIASDRNEISTRRRILELERGLLQEVRTEVNLLSNFMS